MKKNWLLLTLLTVVGLTGAQASTVSEDALMNDTEYSLMGTFSQHDFAPLGDNDPFDWAFTMLSTGKSYQLQGNTPSDNDLFGWKEVTITTPTPQWYMFQLNGDVDGDGSTKFDWILTSADMNNKSAYKLAGVADDGTFKYSSKLNIDYAINGNTIQTGAVGSLNVSDNSEKIIELDESLLKWENLKDTNGTSYQYSTGIAGFSTYNNKTTITIDNDVVIKREYLESDWNDNEIVNWIEDTPDLLGTHTKGAPTKTVDNLYADCRDILKIKNTTLNSFLSFDKNGILAHCGDGQGSVDDWSNTFNIFDLSFIQ